MKRIRVIETIRFSEEFEGPCSAEINEPLWLELLPKKLQQWSRDDEIADRIVCDNGDGRTVDPFALITSHRRIVAWCGRLASPFGYHDAYAG